MRYLFPVLHLLLLLFACCDVQTQEKGTLKKEVVISRTEPYQIVKSNKFITIPDSLRPDGFHEGMLVIDYFVNSNGKIEGTNLGLLRMKDKAGEKIIWYRNKNMKPITSDFYPEEIKPFLSWAFEYAKTRKIEKVTEPKSDAMWKLSAMVKFK